MGREFETPDYEATLNSTIGVFSSRKMECATTENMPFRYVASGLHPDPDTIASKLVRSLSQDVSPRDSREVRANSVAGAASGRLPFGQN